MQNILGERESLSEFQVYLRPYAVKARLSFVDLEDVAEVAWRVLSEEGHGRAIYELCGASWIDGEAVAEVLSEVLGHRVRPEAQSLRTWEKNVRATGLNGYECDALLAMFRYYDRYGLGGNPASLRRLLRREPTGLAEFVCRHSSAERLSAAPVAEPAKTT
jgi:nucleoside-diphosphate-sugar epimerase